MRPDEKEAFDAGALMGELDGHLSVQFLTRCMLGSKARSARASERAMLACMAASGKKITSEEVRLMGICHDELCRFVREGLPLEEAVQAARSSEKGKAAFNALMEKTLDRMERMAQETGGAA